MTHQASHRHRRRLAGYSESQLVTRSLGSPQALFVVGNPVIVEPPDSITMPFAGFVVEDRPVIVEPS